MYCHCTCIGMKYFKFMCLTVDKKENGVKKSESCKPHHEDTNSGAVIMEEDGESDVNDNSEPVDLERQEQEPGVSSNDNCSPSLDVDVKDNMQ